MLYSVYAVLGVCCTRCMPYSVYDVLLIMAWRDREGWLNFVCLGDGRIEDKKERDERVRGNNHEKLELKRIPWASQFTIAVSAGASPGRAWNNTDTRSPQSNQTSCTPDYSYPLVSSTSFSSSSPISLFLVHNFSIITEHKVKWSLSISPCHDYELALNIVYTEYSIHRVRHTLSTASFKDFVSSLQSHDYAATPGCSFNIRRASLWELKGKVALSRSHSCELTNMKRVSAPRAPCIDCLHRTRPNLLNYGLQVHLQTRSITVSKLARSRPPSVSPHWLDDSIWVRMIMASKFIYTLARSRPWNASPNSHERDLQVHLQTGSITAAQVHLQTRSITSQECITEFTRLSISGTPQIALKHRLQPVQTYPV